MSKKRVKSKKCMNKLIAALLTVLSVSENSAETLSLVSAGKPAVDVVVPADADPQLVSDVAFFTNAVFRCTGALLPVVERRTLGSPAILFEVEKCAFFDADDHAIEFPDARTLLVRGSKLSCRWALNRILEKNFGCVFCFPGHNGTHYPKATDVAIERTPFKGTASLKAERRLYADDPRWERSLGGRCSARHGQFFGHSLWKVLSPKRLRGTPLYDQVMPEIKGERRQVRDEEHHTWQPCFSSDASAEEAIRYLNEYFDEHPNEKVFSIAVNDMGGHCTCARCAAVNGGFEKHSKTYPRYVDYSTVYYTWANRVAEGVAAKHPDVALGLLAYCEVTDPPPFRLHPMLVPFLCTEIHQMMDEGALKRRRELYAAWNEKCDHIANWGYDWGVHSYVVPRLYMGCQRKYFDMKRDGTCPHLDGYFGEGSGLIGEGPKRYLFYRQMFDVNCDFDAEYDRWLKAVGGEAAAPHLRAYYQEWENFWCGEEVRNSPWFRGGVTGVYFIYYNTSYVYQFDLEIMKRATAHLEAAVKATRTSGDADQLERIKRIVAFHRFYESRLMGMGAGHLPAGKPEPAVRFFEDLPEISEAAAAKAKWGARILESVGYPKETQRLRHYRDALAGFDEVSKKVIDGNLMQLLNCAISFAGRSAEVDAAIAKAAADERVLPEIRDRLTTLAKVNVLPNLLDGVEAKKTTRYFIWEKDDLPTNRQVYCTMKITNHKVGGQTCRVFFGIWNAKMKQYRETDEMFLYVGPGETKHVSFFSHTREKTPGGVVGVHMMKSDLADVSEIDVSDLKLCVIEPSGK